MKWRKSPSWLIAAFDAACPDDPKVARRMMFGYPACFVKGNMVGALHQENLVLRLREADRNELLQVPGAAAFEPMPGRVMKEYVVVPPSLIADQGTLRAWFSRAIRYGSTLPSKGRRSRKGPLKAGARKNASRRRTPGSKRRIRTRLRKLVTGHGRPR